MEINELMIGDYVRLKKNKESVWIFEIDGERNVINNEPDGYCSERNIHVSDIEPIPLTEEILEKNEFKKNKISNYETLYLIDKNNEFLYVRCFGGTGFGIGNSFDEEGELQEFAIIYYVHELQHALRMCNIDKEIKL